MEEEARRQEIRIESGTPLFPVGQKNGKVRYFRYYCTRIDTTNNN
jgi:hypothetical protein